METTSNSQGTSMKKDQIKRIGWINNRWVEIDEFCLPICDRGLQMADGIFETILILNGQPKLLNEHLNRWQYSASILGMSSPPKLNWLEPLIEEGLERTSLNQGSLRLNWTRGNNLTRGITLPKKTSKFDAHRFWLELNSYEPVFHTKSIVISQLERRNQNSLLSKCKTFAYNQAIQARKEANDAGFDDALILNTNGEVCCGTTSNILVHRKNEWLTPRESSGCLPGIMRGEGIKKGIIKEAIIKKEPEEGDHWVFINSLSCHPISSVNNKSLKILKNTKELWETLLTR
ncbi:aminotransferase class IV [Prochlorococcus sp. MIT 1341]|uniref:aminotransferase class IV n=1 Tax=Prochlorococcus sp. MIT 1341 TaxID=3096221 RepID=UPI002A755C92|nr:aminotransferase class IV [Prochlorococcus sp. MIT 1341]